MELLRTHNFQIIGKMLNSTSIRQAVIANNIANADTPHFKRSIVPFADVLQQAQDDAAFVGNRTDPRHFPIGQRDVSSHPPVFVDAHTKVNTNGNNVEIDREMTLLAQNQLLYNTMVRQMSHEIKHLKTAMEAR
jgi:flagellar basal-body rod protein FlgB